MRLDLFDRTCFIKNTTAGFVHIFEFHITGILLWLLIVLSKSCALLMGCNCTGHPASLSATGAGSVQSPRHPAMLVHLPVSTGVDSRSGISSNAPIKTQLKDFEVDLATEAIGQSVWYKCVFFLFPNTEWKNAFFLRHCPYFHFWLQWGYTAITFQSFLIYLKKQLVSFPPLPFFMLHFVYILFFFFPVESV